MKKHGKKSTKARLKEQRLQLKLENDVVEHSAAALTCATEAADELVKICNRHLEELELDLPYLRVALEIWAEHPELAQPLRTRMQKLLQLLSSQETGLKEMKQELERLATDPAPHVHLDPAERYHPLIRERLLTGHSAAPS